MLYLFGLVLLPAADRGGLKPAATYRTSLNTNREGNKLEE